MFPCVEIACQNKYLLRPNTQIEFVHMSNFETSPVPIRGPSYQNVNLHLARPMPRWTTIELYIVLPAAISHNLAARYSPQKTLLFPFGEDVL